MTFSQLATTSLGSTMRMRSAKPSHVEWKPSAGQVRARDFLTSSTRGALWADPGAGKTSITLAAYVALRELGLARTMLVVAPLRVCQLQWRQEAKQWTQFKDLKVTFLHGDKKGKLLHSEPSDIYLINFDGLVWLSKQFRGNLPFDIVCLDESTKIKNYSAERSKALRRCTAATRYKWMLTGTPSPNGYMDLFGQFLWLDGGQALGKHVTAYREKYFKPAFNGFDYTLQKGGDERIELAIAKLVHRLPFTDLPPLTNDVRWVTMSPEAKRIHKALNDDQVVVIGEHTIVAGSTGALQSAREQAANGALYVRPGEHEFVAFDDGKLDALDELIEEMNGQPLLIAFQFHHDIERIKARRGDKIAVLAGGVSAKEAERIQTAWNAGEISELYVHPASIGHGLNLQRGGAAHLCWFSATFDLELWEQLIRRIWRQGNRALKIVNHILAMVGTIDVDKLEAIEAKSVDQAQLLQAMSETPAQPDQKETTMTERLGFQGQPAAPAATWGAAPAAPASPAPAPAWGPQAAAPAAAPAWGAQPAAAPAAPAWGAQPAPGNPEIAGRIQAGYAPAAEAPTPAAGWAPPNLGFSPDVAAAAGVQQIQTGGERIDPAQTAPAAEPRKRASRAKPAAEAAPSTAPIAMGAGVEYVAANPTGYAAPPPEEKVYAGHSVHMEVKFFGTPSEIRRAMQEFLGH